MSRYSREPNDCKVYVGDLQKDASEKELERAFAYYGRLKSVWVARNPPGFAFVEFEDYRDAEDAIKELDGTHMCGCRVRVEPSTGKVRPKPWSRGGGRGPPRSRRAFNPDDRCYECGDRGHYAYDCQKNKRGYGGGSGRSRKRSRLAKISIPSGLDLPTSLRIELMRPSIFMFFYNIHSSLTCIMILIVVVI